MPRPPRLPTPYLSRPLRFRRDRFVALRWRIRQDPDGRGVFACGHALPGTPTWYALGMGSDSRQSHADIRFLSREHARQGRIYRALVETVDQGVMEWLEDVIQAELDGQLRSAGLSAHHAWSTRGELPALQALAGRDNRPRTVMGWLADRWARVAQEHWRQAPVRLGVREIAPSPHAVLVSATLPVGNLTADALAQFVHEFQAGGERLEQAPVDFEAARDAIAAAVSHTAGLYRQVALAQQARPLAADR